MTAENYIKALLVAEAHREAGHHGGMANTLAVMQVLRNRQRAGWFGGDWMKVIAAAAENAGTRRPDVYVPPDLRDAIFQMILRPVDDLFQGSLTDATDGALYYCELNRVDNAWFLDNIVRKPEEHARVATVGPVSFFK